jgi:hypothetical protein
MLWEGVRGFEKFLGFWDFFKGVLSEMIEFKDSGWHIADRIFPVALL